MKLKDGTVINCKTQEDAEKLLKECGKQGIKTKSNDDVIKLGIKDYNVWNLFKENTCYRIEKSCSFDGLKIEFDEIQYYKSLGYKIIEFEDLFKTESKFKVGDKVRIIDKGKQYSTYRDFIKNKLPKRLKDFKYGEIVPCDEEYKVVFVEKREDDNEYICVIEDLNTKQIFMIQDIGVELIKEEKKMSKCKVYEMPEYVGSNVKKIIINEPCVVVILNSGEKGVAKCCPEDKFIEERGYKLALARAIKEKYLNDVVRQDELIKQYIEEFEYKNTIKYYRNEFDKLQRLRSK